MFLLADCQSVLLLLLLDFSLHPQRPPKGGAVPLIYFWTNPSTKCGRISSPYAPKSPAADGRGHAHFWRRDMLRHRIQSQAHNQNYPVASNRDQYGIRSIRLAYPQKILWISDIRTPQAQNRNRIAQIGRRKLSVPAQRCHSRHNRGIHEAALRLLRMYALDQCPYSA